MSNKTNEVQFEYLSPGHQYEDTQANIEALVGVLAGAVAFATDIKQPGTYNGLTWDWLNSTPVSGGDIPIVTTDPVTPTDGEMWLLRETTGAIADGTAMGMLAMTYTGNIGAVAPLKLSVNDDGTTRRLTFV